MCVLQCFECVCVTLTVDLVDIALDLSLCQQLLVDVPLCVSILPQLDRQQEQHQAHHTHTHNCNTTLLPGIIHCLLHVHSEGVRCPTRLRELATFSPLAW